MIALVSGVIAASRLFEIERECFRVDVDKHRLRAGRRNRERRSDERIGAGDHFIARADTQAFQNQGQR